MVGNFGREFKDFFGLGMKYLIYNLTSRNLKLKYRRSFFGAFWTFLVPAAMAGVYFFIFKYVIKVQIENYLIFVLSGVIPWTFFSNVIIFGMESIVCNGQLLNKVPIPPNVFPLSEALTGFINLLFSLPVLLVVLVLSKISISLVALFCMLPLILMLSLQAYSLSLMLGEIFVYFRDLRHVVAIGMQIWFYLTPVVYSADMIPEQANIIRVLNPVFYLFQGFHSIMAYGVAPSLESLLIALAWTTLLAIGAFQINRKLRWNIAENA